MQFGINLTLCVLHVFVGAVVWPGLTQMGQKSFHESTRMDSDVVHRELACLAGSRYIPRTDATHTQHRDTHMDAHTHTHVHILHSFPPALYTSFIQMSV